MSYPLQPSVPNQAPRKLLLEILHLHQQIIKLAFTLLSLCSPDCESLRRDRKPPHSGVSRLPDLLHDSEQDPFPPGAIP